MSEYWKSTPKYWCKHCSTFVRDTKLEKTNHEATPKHQGNLKRFLRDLHRGHEKDEKDKERAKAEVARLNGMVTGERSVASSSSTSSASRAPKPYVPRVQATASQILQQRAQLAEMGVAVPDEFRPDLAIAGDWQVTSERILGEDEGDKKPDALALGVRKRKPNEEEEEALEVKKARWGRAYKSRPGEEEDEGDLDALLSNVTRKDKLSTAKTDDNSETKLEVKEEIKTDSAVPEKPISLSNATHAQIDVKSEIKTEPEDGANVFPTAIILSNLEDSEIQATPAVVFKKRKAKSIRQK